jgi:hypothetical protein
MFLLVAEIFIWWYTSPLRQKDTFHSHVHNYTRQLSEQSAAQLEKKLSFPGLATSKVLLANTLRRVEGAVVWTALLAIRIVPMKRKPDRLRTAEKTVRDHFETLHNLTARDWFQRALFTPLEFSNMVWLCYLVIAQTLGAFNNCACMTSNWGAWGGYLDFKMWDQANSGLVERYWIIGTTITCVFMGIGMFYIILEVCQPSCDGTPSPDT